MTSDGNNNEEQCVKLTNNIEDLLRKLFSDFHNNQTNTLEEKIQALSNRNDHIEQLLKRSLLYLQTVIVISGLLLLFILLRLCIKPRKKVIYYQDEAVQIPNKDKNCKNSMSTYDTSEKSEVNDLYSYVPPKIK